ncbi:S1 family peptidase [Sinomonas mesophila]|uniref:S1 family peptidase n=1 Tax=Sinomonas mesophila TaxID=1531955 RepID=UPI0011158DC7|nr:serine protease [Sinomonas mesophila]
MTTLRPSLRHVVVACLAALSALALALLGPGSPTPAHAASANDAEKSIVYLDLTFDGAVKVPFTSGTESYTASVAGGCTGWFASTQAHIVTAAHCVEKDDDVRLAILEKVLDSLGYSEYLQQGWDEDWASVTGVTVRAYQPQGVEGAMPALQTTGLTAQLIDAQTFDNGDLALLKIADLDGTSPLAVAATSPGVKETVTAVGFAGSVTDVSDASRQRASFKSGTVSSRQVTTTGVPITEIDAAVTNGMSGGPTLDAAGSVMGVNSFKPRGEEQAFNFVTDTEALKSFLSRNGVKPAAATPSTAPSGSTVVPLGDRPNEGNWFADNLALVLTVGGLAVLLLAVGTALVVVLARKKRVAQGPVQPGQAAQFGQSATGRPELSPAYAPSAPQEPTYSSQSYPEQAYPAPTQQHAQQPAQAPAGFQPPAPLQPGFQPNQPYAQHAPQPPAAPAPSAEAARGQESPPV